jgi:heterotetrameric sarcosine oxidase delta subunit
MRIPCPYCGERSREEFTVLGSAEAERPSPTASAESWVVYLHLRANPAGVHQEFWHHTHGCRAWLIVTRDTVTHTVLAVTPALDRARAAA